MCDCVTKGSKINVVTFHRKYAQIIVEIAIVIGIPTECMDYVQYIKRICCI